MTEALNMGWECLQALQCRLYTTLRIPKIIIPRGCSVLMEQIMRDLLMERQAPEAVANHPDWSTGIAHLVEADGGKV